MPRAVSLAPTIIDPLWILKITYWCTHLMWSTRGSHTARLTLFDVFKRRQEVVASNTFAAAASQISRRYGTTASRSRISRLSSQLKGSHLRTTPPGGGDGDGSVRGSSLHSLGPGFESSLHGGVSFGIQKGVSALRTPRAAIPPSTRLTATFSRYTEIQPISQQNSPGQKTHQAAPYLFCQRWSLSFPRRLIKHHIFFIKTKE